MPTQPAEPAALSLQHLKLLRDLGTGIWGATWVAEDLRLARKILLRILPPRVASDAAFVKRLRQDVEAVSRLNDMNVVRAIGVGEEAGKVFLVLEHCEGETLDRRLQREPFLHHEEATAVVIQAARGLRYAHRQGCLHRDLRPSSLVMVGGLAKILDLGLTRPAAEAGAAGPDCYRAPEQVAGDASVDVRADLYALGATYYHLVTGMPPVCGTTDVLPDPRDIRAAVSDGVAHVIRRLMARRREDRYADADALLADLERVVDGLEPTSPPVDPSLSVVAPARIQRAPKAAPAAPAALAPSVTVSPARAGSPAPSSSIGHDDVTPLDLPPVKPQGAPARVAPATTPRKPAAPVSKPPPPAPKPAVPGSKPAAADLPPPPTRPMKTIPAPAAPPAPAPASVPAPAPAAVPPHDAKKAALDVADAIAARAKPLIQKARQRPALAGAVIAGAVILLLLVILVAGGGSGRYGNSETPAPKTRPAKQTPVARPPEPAAAPAPVVVAAPAPAVMPAPAPAIVVVPSPAVAPPPRPAEPDWAALDGEAWIAAVRELPAEMQVRRVVEKLKRLNPAYDGRETHVVADGRVAGLVLAGPAVKEITPVRALAGLRKLVLSGTGVTDLAALEGLPLAELGIAGAPVRDLAPLRGMPLVLLDCRGAPVASLAPLSGCPIAELACDFNPARDAETLHAFTALRRINGMDVAAFWDSVDKAAAIAKAGESLPDDPAWANATDLLALVEPKKDAIRGTWTVQNGELASDAAAGARVELPYLPPEEYDVRIRFTRRIGNGDVVQILTQAGRPFAWRMGAESNTLFGFAPARAGEGPPAVRMAYCLETGRPYTALVQVRKDGVTATLNGRPIAEWKSGFPGAGVDPSWKLVHDGIPGLGSHESPTVFHKAELRAVTGTGRLLRPAPAVTGDGTGLRGAYYVGKHLEDAPVFTRVDPTVDFNWDIDAPDTRMPADAFSVRWLGQVLAQYTEPYTFTTVADDGVRLWVDGKLLIDDWKATGRKTENSATVNLKAGTRYSIKLEYVEFRAEALVRLMWSSPSTAKAVIPRSQLFPAP